MTFPDEIPYPGSTYDPVTGTIKIGIAADDSEVVWKLNTPGAGVNHGLIVGAPGIGKTNILTLIILEAMSSGIFAIMMADPSDRHNVATTWGASLHAIADSTLDTISMLEAACRMIDVRLEHGGYTYPTREKPGIIIAIDECHHVFPESRHATALAETIVARGGLASVGLIVTSRSAELSYFGNSRILRDGLSSSNAAGMGAEGFDHLSALEED